MLAFVLICIFSYLLGSIPTGYWLGKLIKGIDIRTVGSCSTGATNVLRTVGKPAALFTLIFDISKGAVPVLLAMAASDPLSAAGPLPEWLHLASDPLFAESGPAGFFAGYYILPFLAAAMALLGHSKSIFLGFTGGKSAATGLGALVAMSPAGGALLFVLFVSTIFLTRYVSLASMTAAFAGPFFIYYFTDGKRLSFVAFAIAGGAYVILRHKANIKRLLAGTEPKIGQKSKTASPEEIKPEGKEGKEGNVQENQDSSGKSTALVILLLALLAAGSAATAAPAKPSTQAKPAATSNKAAASKTAKAGSSQSKARAKWPEVFQTAPPGPITAEEANNIRVYKAASKAVVNVTTSTVTPESVMYGINPSSDTGSGSIISEDGYILTNHHVINNASVVRVTLYDGTPFMAKIVGTDPDKDLAVLKIDPGNRKLASLKFGDSSTIEVGRNVYAIGNPFGLDLSMTSGIISSVGRTMKSVSGRLIKGVLQTDASINPGNSGGPLLDENGNMIGVTTAILSRVGQSSGIGFAIPINVVKRAVPQLVEHGFVLRPDLGILSVRVVNTNLGTGLMIASIDPQGPAALAGLKGPTTRRGHWGAFEVVQLDNSTADVILGIDSERVSSIDDLLSYIETKKPGQVVTLNVLRQGQVERIPVKLSETKAHSD